MRNTVNNEYFEWLSNIVCKDRFSKNISYKKLLMCLHDIEFEYRISKDANRAKDGIRLRHRFSYTKQTDVMTYLDGPCTVLEMLIALAIRCEEDTMHDAILGDRTKQWFWGMITNLGLGGSADEGFDKAYVIDVVNRFLNREYEPNGKGGLFTVNGCRRDLRKIEIWHQLCLYLDTIT